MKADENAYDYIDSFEGTFIDKNDDITSVKIGKSFFMSGPQWVNSLFAFRNKLVGFFGLKTSG
ncbi:MAG TPA: DUF2867 domain-containing protein, partial [Bacillota bacterium]|nr:DUF2867 domain-containing protein [Bacillota bacterium]